MIPNITILIFTDGRRECFKRTVASMQAAWGSNPVSRIVIINDSADEDHKHWLARNYSGYEQVHHTQRRGFAGAIQSGWSMASDAEFVFHLEDDFTFNEEIDVHGMTTVLNANPHLVQVALLRQPWNPQEEAAGGIMQLWPDLYDEQSAVLRTNGMTEVEDREVFWTEHRLFFTTNPSFYRGELTLQGWPDGPRSEEKFGASVLQDPAARFAFWGRKLAEPKVHHIGEHRVGTGY